MSKLLDEFLSLKMSAHEKLIAVFLATRPPQDFTHAEVADATFTHPADVERSAINLLRGKEHDTPMHPIIEGHPACFRMAAKHPLRAAIDELVGEKPAQKSKGAK